MKKHLFALAAIAVLALVAGNVLAEKKEVKSGPQAGEKLAGPFHPLNINGSKAGQKNCLYCSNGNKPVAMVFAREVTPALTSLIKKIDAVNEQNKDTMGSFVVFLGERDGLEDQLKKMAEESGLKNTVLSVDGNPAGPQGYNVSKDADVTVVLYVERTAKVNHAYRKGGLNEKALETIVSELPTILK
jgi:hypothetical protein